MALNSINLIIEAVSTPLNFFKTISSFSVIKHENGDVMFYPSNFAITVKVLIDSKYYALKCYAEQNNFRIEHFDELKKFFQLHNRPYFVDFQFLDNEIIQYDNDGKIIYFDVLLTPWIDGKTLHNEIFEAAHLGKIDDISIIRSKFLELVKDFSTIGFAHGDLKPQNIIFEQETHSLKVIDYDASWIESISHLENREVGTFWYQHPERQNNHWSYNVDNYSIVLIVVSLIAIEKNPHIFEKYNNKENIIFSPSEIIDGSSFPFSELLVLWKRESTLIAFLLSLKCRLPYSNNIIDFIDEVIRYDAKSSTIDKAQIIDSDGEYRRYYNEFGLYGYVDRNSNVSLYSQWNDATAFKNSRAIVRSGGLSYFVYGNCQISDIGFDKIENYDSTYAVVKYGDKYGIIDLLNFNFIVKPEYSSSTLFFDEIAIVSSENKYFLIDKNSQRVSQSSYDYCSGYDNNYFIVMTQGEYWLMDRYEKIVSDKTENKLLYMKNGFLYYFANNEIVKVSLGHLKQNNFLPL